MEDNTIDGEVVENEAPQEVPQRLGFDFADRFVQQPSEVQAKVQARIKMHEEQLTEEELELWEIRIQAADPTALEQRIAGRRALIQIYVSEYNLHFEGQGQKKEGESDE